VTTNIQFEYDGDVIFEAQDLTCIPRQNEGLFLPYGGDRRRHFVVALIEHDITKTDHTVHILVSPLPE